MVKHNGCSEQRYTSVILHRLAHGAMDQEFSCSNPGGTCLTFFIIPYEHNVSNMHTLRCAVKGKCDHGNDHGNE